MVYVRAGTVSEEPGIVTKVLDLPYRIYQFLMFFVMTLIDVRTHAHTPIFLLPLRRDPNYSRSPVSCAQPSAARKASQMANKSRGNVRKLGGMKNIGGGGGGCGPVGG